MLPNRSVDLGVTRTSLSGSESYCSCRDVEDFHDLPHRSANLELGASVDLEPAASALRLPSFMSRGMTLKA